MSGLVVEDPESLTTIDAESLITLDAESLITIDELFEWLKEDKARLKVKFVDPNQPKNKKRGVSKEDTAHKKHTKLWRWLNTYQRNQGTEKLKLLKETIRNRFKIDFPEDEIKDSLHQVVKPTVEKDPVKSKPQREAITDLLTWLGDKPIKFSASASGKEERNGITTVRCRNFIKKSMRPHHKKTIEYFKLRYSLRHGYDTTLSYENVFGDNEFFAPALTEGMAKLKVSD